MFPVAVSVVEAFAFWRALLMHLSLWPVCIGKPGYCPPFVCRASCLKPQLGVYCHCCCRLCLAFSVPVWVLLRRSYLVAEVPCGFPWGVGLCNDPGQP